MRNIRVGKQTFVMTEKDEMKMEESGINMFSLRQRINKGWDFYDAIEAPVGMRRKEWNALKRMERAESLKERIQRRRKEELRRKKPHLFEVPQVHPRGEWCKHLMENDIFPRKVVRS